MRIPSLPAWPAIALALTCASSLSLAQSVTELCRDVNAGEVIPSLLGQRFKGVVSPIDGTCFIEGKIASFDKTELEGNLFLPKRTSEKQTFPTIVMIGSWGADGLKEYRGLQQRLAKDGYMVAAYSARGFHGSGGLIGAAGPDDVADVTAVIDWLLQHAPVDPDKIAASGISYGAGLSMMALAKDKRIKTAVALSGWGTMADELYPAGSPNNWGGLLLLGTLGTGRPSKEVLDNTWALLNPDSSKEKVAEIIAWAKPRSASSYVDAINARKAPVFISKNFQDDLFTPNSSLAMFAALKGPKKIVLNTGIHGSAEGLGAVLGIDNYPYDEARRWFERWLKGVNNGIDTEPQVTMQVKFTDHRENFKTWPAPELKDSTYYLGPREFLSLDGGCLCLRIETRDKGSISLLPNFALGSDLIWNSSDTEAKSGSVPILSALGESFNIPVLASMGKVDPSAGVRYEGHMLWETQKIRGIPKLNLRLKPSQARAQVVAYLYDVDIFGTGKLITHGAATLHWATPGQTIDFPIDLAATAYDVPPGHHIGIVLDTTDSHFAAPVKPGESFNVRFEFDVLQQATLVLPTL